MKICYCCIVLLDRSNGIVALLKILDQCCVLMIDQFIVVYNQKISKLLFCNCLLELETIVFVTFRSVTNRIFLIFLQFLFYQNCYIYHLISFYIANSLVNISVHCIARILLSNSIKLYTTNLNNTILYYCIIIDRCGF